METTASIAGAHYPGQAYNIAAPADEVIGHSIPPSGDDLITGKIAAPRAAPHQIGLQPLRGCLKPPRWRQAVSARVRLVDEARCVVTGDVCAPHERDSAEWRSDVRYVPIYSFSSSATDHSKHHETMLLVTILLGDFETPSLRCAP